MLSRTTSNEEIVRVSAPAKINLHLEVLGLRDDGFHELAMVMQSINLTDLLTFRACPEGTIQLICDQPSLSTGEDNLVVRAAKLLKSLSKRSDLGVSIDLQKRIPIGAGLAGGSTDGAAALVGLNALWGLNFSSSELESMAAELGSDMPFCVAGGTQLCFGRGELLEPLPSIQEPMAVVLIKDPSVSVSTPWAYGRYKDINQDSYLKANKFESRRQALREKSWLPPLRSSDPPPLHNDLQNVVVPEILAVKNALSLLHLLPNSLSVAMSGSGPSCFALFADLRDAKSAINRYQKAFDGAGLESWCCSLLSHGVKLEQ